MKIIKVTKRTDDYHACISGQPGYWDCGKSPREAIGNLVQTHPEMFGVKIELPAPMTPEQPNPATN